MLTPHNDKPLTTKAIESMKPGCKDKADVGENRGYALPVGLPAPGRFFTAMLAQSRIN